MKKAIPLLPLSLLTIALVSFTGSATPPMWSEGHCSDDTNQGASRDYYNSGIGFKWQNYMGDWQDSTNTAQGESPFAELSIPDLDEQQSFEVDLTAMAASWVNKSYPNQGILIKTGNGGKTHILSKENADSNLAPTLIIQTTDGSYSLIASADTTLRSNTYTCAGHFTDLSTTGNILLHFDLSVIPEGSQVVHAQLSLSTAQSQYGISNLAFYRVSIAAKSYGGEDLASKYPNDYQMIDDENVLFVESFEQEDWTNNWSGVFTSHELVTMNSSEDFSPLMGKALQSKLPTGELTALNAVYNFEDKLGADLDEVYFRYNLRFGSTWQTLKGGKLPGIAGRYTNTDYVGGWGGRSSNGTNGWSARGVFWQVLEDNNTFSEQVPIGNYIYHADQAGTWGDSIIYDGSRPGVLEKATWYSIEQYVKINTPGENDGIIRAWIDGELAYEKTDLKFRNVGYENIKIDQVWMNIYHGGITPNDRDIYAFIDNVVIAKEYIGPLNYHAELPKAGTEPNRLPVITTSTPENISLQAFEGVEINATVTDKDGDTVTNAWYLNGELTDNDSLSYQFTSSYFALGEQVIELKSTDSKGETSVKAWSIKVAADNFIAVNTVADAGITTSTYQSKGTLDTFRVSMYGANTGFLRFPQPEDIHTENIKSATLILHDYQQFGELEMAVYAGTENWVEGEGIDDGVTRDYSDRGNGIAWENYMGDWFDSTGEMNGTVPYLTTSISDTDSLKKVYLDITELVKDHNADDAINVVLKPVSGGKHDFYTKEATLDGVQPILLIETH